MKKIVAVILIFFLSGCERASAITTEEKVMIKGLSGYVIGLAWDEICNGTNPQSRYEDFTKKENVNLIGNRQLFGARLGGVLHVRHPKKSADEILLILNNMEKSIDQKARQKLKGEGCGGETAKAASKTYLLFSSTHPAVINKFMDKSIVDAGGTVTSSDEIESTGVKP